MQAHGVTKAAMPARCKPIVFISYAREDEPEAPAKGEVKWLSFVTEYLGPAEQVGVFEMWIDRMTPSAIGIRKVCSGCAPATSSCRSSLLMRYRANIPSIRRLRSFASGRQGASAYVSIRSC